MGAVESKIAESQHWFVGEDRAFVYYVQDGSVAQATVEKVIRGEGTTAEDAAVAAAAVNVSTWALEWNMRTDRAPNGTEVIVKATGGDGITTANGFGTGDKITVVVDDTDTDDSDDQSPTPLEAATYFVTLKRTDEGSQAVLAFGDAVLQRADV
jgi:hypothetical protein